MLEMLVEWSAGVVATPYLQYPLINPDVRFSLIRLSDVRQQVAFGSCLYHLTVPASVCKPRA